MRFLRRSAVDEQSDPLLGSGTGPIRTKHMQRIDLEAGCAGDGMGDPCFCQTHLSDWFKSHPACDAVIVYRRQCSE